MPYVTVEIGFYNTDAGFNPSGVPNEITSRFEFAVSGDRESRKAQIKDQLAELGYSDAATAAYLAGLVDGRLQAEAISVAAEDAQ
jgi:hypothetical protein